MTFAYPWLLATPLLYLALILTRRKQAEAAPFSSAILLRQLPSSIRLKLRGPVLWTLMLASVVSLSIAAARPQKITLLEQPLKGRNIMLVVDASRSMLAQDFPMSFGHASRMDGVRTVVSEYVRNRHHDRVGLIVFGEAAYLQSPLTSDTSLVDELVQGIRPGMAGDGTAIGDGLGLALKRLKEVEEGSKAIILMTDGVNNAGQVSPIKAAQVAKDLGIQVHTIGIGSGTAPIVDPRRLSGMLGIGIGNMAEFDEATLKRIAETTGGVYFNASSLEGFKDVYRQIEKLTAIDVDQPDRTLVEELFWKYALAGALCYLLALMLSVTLFMKVP
jgi:Ca-activated chloride channel family protein